MSSVSLNLMQGQQLHYCVRMLYNAIIVFLNGEIKYLFNGSEFAEEKNDFS